jgi:hypothetical protein
MQNGQLKPAYNLQIGTENQFLTHFDFFSNPTDTLTMVPFFKGWEERYNCTPQTAVADAGYGSEENYEFMEDNEVKAFVKYNYFHAEQKKKFLENAFIAQNLFYNATDDYFVCPMGQHLQNKGRTTKTNQHGYKSEITVYEAANCNGCPLRCLCHKAKGNHRIEINHNLRRLKAKARELLLSEQGLKHRKKRCVEPEPVFSHIRYDGAYLRFRHFGQGKVEMDFALMAIALNLAKLARRMFKSGENPENQSAKQQNFVYAKLTLSKIKEKFINPISYVKIAA